MQKQTTKKLHVMPKFDKNTRIYNLQKKMGTLTLDMRGTS